MKLVHLEFGGVGTLVDTLLLEYCFITNTIVSYQKSVSTSVSTSVPTPFNKRVRCAYVKWSELFVARKVVVRFVNGARKERGANCQWCGLSGTHNNY